jgi:hypothetical protein
MSLAGVACSPRTCSGLAYSGVIRRMAVAVGVRVSGESSGFKSLAMPKSSSFGVPSEQMMMFEGLMSRWTTRFWCA